MLHNILKKLSEIDNKLKMLSVAKGSEEQPPMIEIVSSESEPEEDSEELESEDMDFSWVVLPPKFLDPLTTPEEPRFDGPANNTLLELNFEDKVPKGEGIVTYKRF